MTSPTAVLSRETIGYFPLIGTIIQGSFFVLTLLIVGRLQVKASSVGWPVCKKLVRNGVTIVTALVVVSSAAVVAAVALVLAALAAFPPAVVLVATVRVLAALVEAVLTAVAPPLIAVV